jgi:hypothetical protein
VGGTETEVGDGLKAEVPPYCSESSARKALRPLAARKFCAVLLYTLEYGEVVFPTMDRRNDGRRW